MSYDSLTKSSAKKIIERFNLNIEDAYENNLRQLYTIKTKEGIRTDLEFRKPLTDRIFCVQLPEDYEFMGKCHVSTPTFTQYNERADIFNSPEVKRIVSKNNIRKLQYQNEILFHKTFDLSQIKVDEEMSLVETRPDILRKELGAVVKLTEEIDRQLDHYLESKEFLF